MNKQKYVVFGGSFDPFTEAHRAVVKALYDDFKADLVVIVPSTVSWHREGKLPWMSKDEKLSAICNMLNGIPYSLRTDEICRQEICPSIQSTRGFIDMLADIAVDYSYSDSELWFCIGSDQLELFPKWKMADEILKIAKMVVVQGRNGKTVVSDIPHETICIDDKYANISASNVRTLYAFKQKTPEDYIQWAYNKYARVKSTDLVAHTPIFDVVKGPETDTGLRPILVKAPDWVTIIVEKSDAILVEQQFRYGANDYVEEFPCGMVEEGEDPLDAAARELEEETGISILDKKDFVKLGSTNPNPAFMTNKMHYFYINLDYAKHKIVEQKLDEHEKLEVGLTPKDKFIARLADNAYAENGKVVPAIALSAVKLLERMKSASC